MPRADIFQLIEDGDVDAVEAALEKSKMKVHDFNKMGYPPLSVAVNRKDHNMVRRLLAAGAQPNGPCSSTAGTYEGYTPMHFAAKANDKGLLQMLFEQGGSPKLQAKDGWSPLHVACFNKAPDSIQWLVEKKVDLNVLNEHRVTPIIALISHGKMDSLRVLLKAGAKLETRDISGDTVMHHALHCSMHKLFEGSYTLPEIQLDAAVTLAMHGVDPEALNRDGVKATAYIEKEFGSDLFVKVLKLLYMNGKTILASEGEYTDHWNYMTLLSIKNRQVWENLGVHPQQAKDLVDYLHQFDEERKRKSDPKANKPPPKKRTTPLQRVGDDSSDDDDDDDEAENSDDTKGSQAAQPVPQKAVPPPKAPAAAAAAPKALAEKPADNVLKGDAADAVPKVVVKKTPLASMAQAASAAAPVQSAPTQAVLAPAQAEFARPAAAAMPAAERRTEERVVEKIVEVKWQHPSSLPPPVFDASWAYHNRTAILCCIISFLLGNSLTVLRC